MPRYHGRILDGVSMRGRPKGGNPGGTAIGKDLIVPDVRNMIPDIRDFFIERSIT